MRVSTKELNASLGQFHTAPASPRCPTLLPAAAMQQTLVKDCCMLLTFVRQSGAFRRRFGEVSPSLPAVRAR